MKCRPWTLGGEAESSRHLPQTWDTLPRHGSAGQATKTSPEKGLFQAEDRWDRDKSK